MMPKSNQPPASSGYDPEGPEEIVRSSFENDCIQNLNNQAVVSAENKAKEQEGIIQSNSTETDSETIKVVIEGSNLLQSHNAETESQQEIGVKPVSGNSSVIESEPNKKTEYVESDQYNRDNTYVESKDSHKCISIIGTALEDDAVNNIELESKQDANATLVFDHQKRDHIIRVERNESPKMNSIETLLEDHEAGENVDLESGKCQANKNKKLNNPAESSNSEDSCGSSSTDEDYDDDLDEEMSWKDRTAWLFTIFVKNKFRWFFFVTSVIFLVLAFVFNKKFPTKTWGGVDSAPIWRWFLYIGMAFPSFTFAEMFIVACMFALKKLILLQSVREDEDLSKLVNNVGLFTRRYATQLAFLVWASLLLLSWWACFQLTAYNLTPSERQKWDHIYHQWIGIHYTLLLFTAGNIAVSFIEFTYLTQFSAKTLSERMTDSIFEQVVVSGLLGCQDNRSDHELLLLPPDLFKWSPSDQNDNIDTANRKAHSAERYVTKNKLESIFAYRLGLMQEKSEFVMQAVKKRLKVQISKFRKRQEKHQKNACTVQFTKIPDQGTDNSVQSRPRRESTVSLISCSESTSSGHSFRTKRNRQISKKVLSAMLVEAYGDAMNLEKALKFLDNSEGRETIPLKLLELAIERSFSNRKNLRVALSDNKTIARQVKSWVQTTVNVLVVFISLFFFGIDATKMFIGISGTLVSFSFMFGHSVSTTLENLLFLYGTHPYDVGDTIRIGPNEELFTIKRVWLRTTEMLNIDDEVRIIQNSTMSTIEPLYNLSKSDFHWLVNEFDLDISGVTQDFKDKVQADLQRHFAKHPEMFTGKMRLDTRLFLAPMKIKCVLVFELPFSARFKFRSRNAQSSACLEFARSIERHGGNYTTYTQYLDTKIDDLSHLNP